MKKCLIITNHSYMLYRFRKELIERIAQTYEVVIATPFVGHEDDLERAGVRCVCVDVDRRSLNFLKDMKLMRAYKRLMSEEKPDLVITYSIKPNIYGGMAAGSLAIPYFANVQGLGSAFQKRGVKQIVTMLYKIALKKVKRVFFENEENARLFCQLSIIPKEKAAVMKGAGINLSSYPLKQYPDNDRVRFLYLGRIMREKGIDELFEAAARLYEKYGDRVTVDLVGFFEDEYKDKVARLCQEGIATFHGFQKDPRPYYEGTDCVVLPSYHEGMSNVLLEAAATGRPVITSDIPGCREALEDGVTGWLCRQGDAEDLYRAMELCLNTPREKREEMGKLGAKKMENEFSREKVVEKTAAVLFN